MPHWNGVTGCEVPEADPGKRLSSSWNSWGEERLRTAVTFTLTPKDRGILLRQEQSGFRTEDESYYRGADLRLAEVLERT
jgi:uncharacterized protein YndB with AHSA1/START domain